MDSRTISIKLKEPLVYALALFGNTTNGGMIVLPKEADSAFDPRGDMIGTGPFSLSSYTQSVGFNFKRNPDYWDQDWALVDQVEMPIITEYAAALAQLKAGGIYRFAHTSSDIRSEDVLPLKREVPRIAVYQGDLNAAGVVGNILAFGWLPAGKAPFLDERVRQAFSMAIDRTAVQAGVASFELGRPYRGRRHAATETGSQTTLCHCEKAQPTKQSIMPGQAPRKMKVAEVQETQHSYRGVWGVSPILFLINKSGADRQGCQASRGRSVAIFKGIS